MIYVDLFNQKPCKTASGDNLQFPDFVAGGSIDLKLRFLEYVGGQYTETDLDIATLRASIGNTNLLPTAGSFKLKLGSAVSTITNTTTALSYAITATDLQTQLNLLTDKLSNFEVSTIAGGFQILRADRQPQSFTIVDNLLVPVSIVQLNTYSNSVELRLAQAPLAYTEQAWRELPEPPVITKIREGGSSMGTEWNEIQELKMNPHFRGTYQIGYGTGKTTLLDITDNPASVEAAINKILNQHIVGGIEGSCKVSNPTTGIAHIEFLGSLSGIAVDLLTIEVYSAPAGDWSFQLDLATQAVDYVLAVNNEHECKLEIEADVYIDTLNHSLGTKKIKFFQSEIKIVKNLLNSSLIAPNPINWMQIRNSNYIPVTTDQIITGQQYASFAIGDGANYDYYIVHGLNSENVATFSIRDNYAGGALLATNLYELTVYDANSVGISFYTNDPPSINQYKGLLTFADLVEAFQPHTHTVQQVVAAGNYMSLTAFMDSIATRLEIVESALPNIKLSIPSTEKTEQSIIIKAKNGVVLNPKSADGKLITKPENLPAKGFKLYSQLKVNGTMSTIPNSANLPLPDMSPVVKKYLGTDTVAMGAKKGGTITLNEYFGADGIDTYKVLLNSNSYNSAEYNYFSPAAYELELFRISLNWEQLNIGRVLQTVFGIGLQTVNANTNIRYGFALQYGTVSGTANGLTAINWSSQYLLYQPITVTENLQTHNFGIKASNDFELGLVTDIMKYNQWATCADTNHYSSNTSTQLVLRAILKDFDTEDKFIANAKGFIAYNLNSADGTGDIKISII